MSSEFGKNLRISIFGESHGAAIGVVVDGLPVGETVDLDALAAFLARRAPGRNAMSTARKETDAVRVLSGLYQGKTSGAPLCMVIENRNAHSNDYERLRHIPRPAHADYSASVRYHDFSDPNGGGHFSGRLTAPLCAAGGVCLQILNRKGIAIGGHLSRCAGVDDAPIDSLRLTAEELAAVAQRPIPVLDENAGMRMQAAVQAAKEQGDSVGGVIEVFGLGIPAGLGSPMFGGVENRLAQAVFGIPAIRGVEFGAGFGAADLRGSQNNDAFVLQEGIVRTKTNRHGGVLGGITTGMPLVMRAAVKPTPSIAQEQKTLDRQTGEQTALCITGRHDPCIAQRAVPCVEAAVAAVLLDLMLDGEYARL